MLINKIASLINQSVTPFHAVATIANELRTAGSREVGEKEFWNLRVGSYHVKRNDSSIIAFHLPVKTPEKINIITAHSDSPVFKLKENPEIKKADYYISLNTEKYGGMIVSTWLDRPLGVAGRIFLMDQDGNVRSELIDMKDVSVVIPSLAIHFNPQANKGQELNLQKDMEPLGGIDASVVEEGLKAYVKEGEEIISSDLFLYNKDQANVWGVNGELFSAPRIDDLGSVYPALIGYIESVKADAEVINPEGHDINILAVFDNEEVDSMTKQGADSTFLRDVLLRIKEHYDLSEEAFQVLLSKSLIVSADNAQALHPNHMEKSDPVNRPLLNKGIVLKFNAEQKYASDGYSAAIFRSICKKYEIPVQNYTNRSDIRGGSTLGSILNSQISIPTVDIGLPQLAMHSAYETAGSKDFEFMKEFATAFYSNK